MFLRQDSSSVMIYGIDIEVMLASKGSCCYMCWTMVMTGSMGTEVKSALTSEDAMMCPGSSFTDLIRSTNSCVFFM